MAAKKKPDAATRDRAATTAAPLVLTKEQQRCLNDFSEGVVGARMAFRMAAENLGRTEAALFSYIRSIAGGLRVKGVAHNLGDDAEIIFGDPDDDA